MGPKKGKKDEVVDESTTKFYKTYRKVCLDNQYKMYKPLDEIFKEKIKEDGHINEVLIPETLGPEKTEDLLKTLTEVKDVNGKFGYKHLNSLRIWNGEIMDVGVEKIFHYIETCKSPNLKILDLANCSIGVEGCKLISEMLNPMLNTDMQFLNLDKNRFGLEGFIQLLNGLKINESLSYLSLAFCDLNEESILYFKEIFQNEKNGLVSLILDGNPIGTKGACNLLKILNPFNKIEEVHLSFCNIIADSEFTACVTSAMQELPLLDTYNFSNNTLNNEFLLAVTEVLKKQKTTKDLHVYQFMAGVLFDPEVFQPFHKLMLGRKKPKKKKKKGKPKKK